MGLSLEQKGKARAFKSVFNFKERNNYIGGEGHQVSKKSLSEDTFYGLKD